MPTRISVVVSLRVGVDVKEERTGKREALPPAGEEAGPPDGKPSLAPGVEEPKKRRTPSLDWAELLHHSFALDIFACARCGGRRRVVASVRMCRLGRPFAGFR